MITPIDDHTVAIQNAADLESVVSANNNITHVHLANDIVLTNGITINPNRARLVIDGEHPLNSGVIHTFTDMYSIGNSDTIGIRESSSIQITLRNMIINGSNYYGVPYITDSAAADTSNLSVTYEGVIYTGRQMTYNIYGLTRYINCNISIINITASWTGEEVGEINRVEIGGNTIITKNNQSDAMFYFRGSASTNSFKILADADVTISTTNYFMFATGRTVPYTIEQGASFKLNTNSGISYASGHQVAPFIVDQNASFEYTQISNGTSIYIPGTLTVKQGARFFMRTEYTAASPLIYFSTSGTQQNLNLENPKSFVLYKRNTPAVTFAASRPFLISGGQVNYWQNAMASLDAGTFSDPPLYSWHNPDWTSFEIRGNVGTAMSSVSSTLSPPVNPSLANLQLQNARVLSVGEIPLEVDPVLNDQRPITGRTDPYANVKVEYADESSAHTLTGTADDEGHFSIQTPASIPADTVVMVSSNIPFLFMMVTVTAIEAGEIFVQKAPERIRFITPVLSRTPLIMRRDSNEPVVVVDTRFYSTKWELMVTIDGNMRTDSGYTLPDAVVFVPEHSVYEDMMTLNAGVSIHIYTGGPDEEITSITWGDDMGILLHVTDPIRLGQEYTANITWSVQPIE